MNKTIFRTVCVCFSVIFSSPALWAQTITTFAGSDPAGSGIGSYAGDGGPATNANLNYPTGLAFDAAGNLYIADRLNMCIRKVSATGIITTVAGTGGLSGYSGDGGPATVAQLADPGAIAFDVHGNMFIAEESYSCIRKVDAAGIITTVAGTILTGGFAGDGGPAVAAALNYPTCIAFDAAGSMYICDSRNYRIRKVDILGIISTIAGSGSSTPSGDGGPATAAGMSPQGILVDHSGAITFCERNNHCIRKIDATGTITTIAGTMVGGFSGDGGPATTAQLYCPSTLTYDAMGNILFVDEYNVRVRKIDASGIITTVAGHGVTGFGGDGGYADTAQFRNPATVITDHWGDVYISDLRNHRVRKISYDHVLPTGIVNASPLSASVYPNPAADVLNISNLAGITDYYLADVSGRVVHKGRTTSGSAHISLRGIKAGIYTLQLTGSDGQNHIVSVLKE